MDSVTCAAFSLWEQPTSIRKGLTLVKKDCALAKPINLVTVDGFTVPGPPLITRKKANLQRFRDPIPFAS